MYQRTREEWNEHCNRVYEFHPGYADALKVSPLERTRAGIILDYVKDKFSPGLSLLDAGCQDGWFSEQFRRQGWAVTGVDPCKKWIESARLKYPQVDFFEGFLEDMGWDKKFDFAMCSETLEHVIDLQRGKFMMALVKALKPGGVLFCSVPLPEYGSHPTHARIYGKKEFYRFVSQYISVCEHIEMEKHWNVIIGTRPLQKNVTPSELAKLFAEGGATI